MNNQCPSRCVSIALDGARWHSTAEQTIRGLRAGDRVSVNGRVFTGRDRLHKYLAEGGPPPVPLGGGAIYHCGPVVAWRASVPASRWRVTAAGPTTSMRNESYMAAIIAAHGIRVIIGKGGMGARTAEACREYGCVYLQAVGGAAALLAQRFRRVGGVYFLDTFGAAEAMWELEADGLEAVVGMDTVGGNLYDEIREQSMAKLERLRACSHKRLKARQ